LSSSGGSSPFLRTYAALLAGVNRDEAGLIFLIMNALVGICWASLFGGGAYLFGAQMKRVGGPVGLLLLLAAVGLPPPASSFFRRHEKGAGAARGKQPFRGLGCTDALIAVTSPAWLR